MAQPRPGTLEALAAAAPDQIVLREYGTGRTRTRAAWDERAGSLAVALGATHGIDHGSRVAILLDRPQLELLDLVYALAKLGAIPIVLPARGLDEVAGADLVVRAAAGPALDGPGLLIDRDLDDLIGGAPGGPRPLSGFRTAPRTVTVSGGRPPRLLERDDAHTDRAALATVVGDLLVRARHRQGRGHLLAAAPALPATLLHANVAALAGGEVVVVPDGGPQAWLAALGEHEPGTAVLTPRQVAQLLALDPAVLDGADTTSLDAVLVAGGYLPVPHRLAAADLLGEESVAPLYATAELGPVALLSPEAVTADPGTAGTPLQGVAVEIRGGDGQPVSRGQVGRIHARSPLRSGEADAAGDHGYRDEAGRLVVLGRDRPDWTAPDGRPVGALAIQDAVLGVPGVHAAVVHGRRLHVHPSIGGSVDPAAITDRVRDACGAAAAEEIEIEIDANSASDLGP